MLSRVKFTFVNSFTDTDVNINISDIKINEVGKVASASISEGNVPTWNITERYALVYDAPAQLTTPNQAVETYYQTMIPEKEEKEYTLSFTVTVVADGKQIACTKYGGDPADADYEEAVKLPETVFENGKGYDFKAHIKPTTVGDIYPIEFNVTVTDWVETGETVIDGFGA
jgi:hypothetical protein